jgi:hypothetical protein
MEGRRTRHTSHGDAIGGFTTTVGQPEPRLRSYVRDYEDYADFTAGASTRREVPVAHAVLIISFGEPYHVIDPRDASRGVCSATFITGLYDSYVDNASPGPTRGIQINLTPLGEYRLLGMPMHEIANRAVDVRDAFGTAGSTLVERLQAAPDSESRFDILDEVFAAACCRRAPTPGVAKRTASCGVRGRSHGALTEERLSRALGAVPRAARLPPKTVARIVRPGCPQNRLRQRRARRWHIAAATTTISTSSASSGVAGATPGEFRTPGPRAAAGPHKTPDLRDRS